jgi:DNA helicase II / ATP-dependent DNA helicase PcrA
MTSLLDDLNERQREAVLTTEGPLLVLAGAGTGKTRVITYRVAYLVEKGTPPGSILAVTFTNKAADVMKQRIQALLQSVGRDASDVWVSTFHSFCARLLRREAPRIGLPRDFAIYDDEDQLSAVKRAMLQLGLSGADYAPKSLRAQISHAKNHGIQPGEMESQAAASQDRARQDAAAVFRTYEEILRKTAALDFDDLLLHAVNLLGDDSTVRAVWNDRYRYILVDEFQDTNHAQEQLVRLLAGNRRNVSVVGDEDQSIYGWRGARAGNLKRFAEDFPGAKTVRLEENYRSTQTILDAAAAVVENNSGRLGKKLRATRGSGEALGFYEANDSAGEAEFVGGAVASLVRGHLDARVAVLYRTGAQSRSFEEVLRRLGIRHRVVGGFSFYGRAEVRNALAYIRLLFHPEDDLALLRVLNVPPRGIGAATVAALEARSSETAQSFWDVIGDRDFLVGKRAAGALGDFREMIEDLTQERKTITPAELIERVLSQTGYLDWVEQQDNLEHTSRAENLHELSNAVAEATQRGETLEDVLDRAALLGEADEYDEQVGVSLMTLHSAKGLEFDSVFLAGLEEGMLPHSRSLDTRAAIEEERRLFYVGMTRAKRSLVLSRALYRRAYGGQGMYASEPSRFLREIPADLIQALPGSPSRVSEARRYEADPEFSQEERTPHWRPTRSAREGRSSRDSLVGTRVRHSKFGLGTIIGVEGEGEDRRLTVSFEDYGPRKLIARYANLQFA